MDSSIEISKNIEKKWYQIVIWWEIRRIPYNIILLVSGLLSFLIAYVSIPVIYTLTGLALNLIYCLVYVFDVVLTKTKKKNLSKKLFLIYLIISITTIFGLSIMFLIR
jgi:amino acid transporter